MPEYNYTNDYVIIFTQEFSIIAINLQEYEN